MHRLNKIMLLAFIVMSASNAASQESVRPQVGTPDTNDARTILARYADAWRGREEFVLREETTVAFWVDGNGGGVFHIVLPVSGRPILNRGPAGSYTVGFQTDIETLRKIDRGEWNALTAMGQARSSDPIPLVPKFPDKFEWTAENRAYFIPFLFHFWNREWPETVRFGESTSRLVHGGNSTVLYYDRGLRTAWYQVKPGMHINKDPEDQTNTFPSMIIVIRGQAHARIGGKARIMREGETILVPPGMTHEFWATAGESAEFIIIMWGNEA